MRSVFLSLVAAALAAPALAQNAQYPPWSAEAAEQARTVDGAPNTAQFGAPPSAQLVTPSQEGSRNVTTAAEAPLHSLNLVNQKIPPVLLRAMDDPYARPSPPTCAGIARAVDELTVALGPDFDAPPPPPPEGGKMTRSGGVGLQLMHGAAGSLLPFSAYIATLSGASKRDAKVLTALNAGSSRRAYLKGLGEARRCPQPAAPRHLVKAGAPRSDAPFPDGGDDTAQRQ